MSTALSCQCQGHMAWQGQLTTEVTEVITVVWELFLPDLTRGVPEAEHEDKRPDVSLLHLSYFVTLMVLYKPQSVTHRPRQAEWKAETEPCSFWRRLAPSHWRAFHSMLHARSWSSGARRRVDVPMLLLLVCRVSGGALSQPRSGCSEPHPLH